MTGKTWCLRKQTQFFVDRKPAFLKSQTAGDLQTAFWPQTRAAFFAVWPNREAKLEQEKIEKAEQEEERRQAQLSGVKKKSKTRSKANASQEGKTFKDHDEFRGIFDSG